MARPQEPAREAQGFEEFWERQERIHLSPPGCKDAARRSFIEGVRYGGGLVGLQPRRRRSAPLGRSATIGYSVAAVVFILVVLGIAGMVASLAFRVIVEQLALAGLAAGRCL